MKITLNMEGGTEQSLDGVVSVVQELPPGSAPVRFPIVGPDELGNEISVICYLPADAKKKSDPKEYSTTPQRLTEEKPVLPQGEGGKDATKTVPFNWVQWHRGEFPKGSKLKSHPADCYGMGKLPLARIRADWPTLWHSLF